MLDCNPEVRRGPLPSCSLTFPGVCSSRQSTSEGDHCPLSAAESSLFSVRFGAWGEIFDGGRARDWIQAGGVLELLFSSLRWTV